MSEPEMVEPSCVWRMAMNGWQRADIAKLLKMNTSKVAMSYESEKARLKGVDPKLIANACLRLKPPQPDS